MSGSSPERRPATTTRSASYEFFGQHAGLTRGSLASRAFVLGYQTSGSTVVATGERGS